MIRMLEIFAVIDAIAIMLVLIAGMNIVDHRARDAQAWGGRL